MTRPIPEASEGAIPYLCIKGAGDAIEFYKKAFGATELFRMSAPDGSVGHAEIRINGRPLYIADEYPDHGFLSPKTLGGTPVMLHLYVDDVDAVVKRAEEAGATVQRPVETQFYGDRGGKLVDPFGHEWYISSHVEDVTPEEMKRRAAEKFGG
ncbi:MAG TPA: VOC family protein [Thermoanaerobaculia bacterium]|nr:VOC family protein [Thermoanaerobaculia bacterium]